MSKRGGLYWMAMDPVKVVVHGLGVSEMYTATVPPYCTELCYITSPKYLLNYRGKKEHFLHDSEHSDSKQV